MIARVPASSANLGPGFDTLSLALSLYVEVEATPADSFSVTSLGEGSELPITDDYLGAKVAREVLGHDNVHLTVRSQIPLGRGLGSSAAFVAACAGSLGAADVFAVASKFDGHPENAAASVFGGFVTATTMGSSYVSRRLHLDTSLSTVVVVPSVELATTKAREVLPSSVDFRDATFNLGRMGMLIAGFANIDDLVPEATQDKLHQDYRSSLFPQSIEMLQVLIDGGAIASCWSGAGPTMIGFCRSSESVTVAKRIEDLLSESSISVSVRALTVDSRGLVLANSYGPDFRPLEVASL